MLILAVDDERIGLSALTDAIRKAVPSAEIKSCQSPREALEFAAKNPVYAAFLDIFMPEIDGIELARKIKLANPPVRIVFATGYDDYMKDAFQLHANGYILKPITPAKVKAEFDNLQELEHTYYQNAEENGKRLRFQCFGNFEAYLDGVPLRFKYDKTKEMLAYIVSRRGTLCSNDEICVNLWEDDVSHESYLRGIRKDLLDVFRDAGISDAIHQQRGKIGINADKVTCDYYDFIAGDVAALNGYKGEFMSQYSWSEMINAEMTMNR